MKDLYTRELEVEGGGGMLLSKLYFEKSFDLSRPQRPHVPSLKHNTTAQFKEKNVKNSTDYYFLNFVMY